MMTRFSHVLALVFVIGAGLPRLHAQAPPQETGDKIEAAVEQVAEQIGAAVAQVEEAVKEASGQAQTMRERARTAAENWGSRPRSTGGDLVRTGASATVPAGEVVSNVVVTQGDATIDGEVTGDVVVIWGKARINGRVWGDVVNVGEGIVMGPEARIRGDAVGILGGIYLGTNAYVSGDAVGIGGGIVKESGASVGGKEVPIAWGNWLGPDGLSLPDWVRVPFVELVLKARPLTFRIGWVWYVWAIFLGIYLLLGVLFPKGCEITGRVLGERGVTAFLVGLLMIPLIPLVMTILAATGIGLVVVPFFLAAVFVAGLLGKAALLLHFGNAIGRQLNTRFPPLVAMIVGSLPLTLLYLVPFLGFVTLKLTDLWALGAATVALFSGLRGEGGNGSAPRPAPLTPAAASTGAVALAVAVPAAPSTPPSQPVPDQPPVTGAPSAMNEPPPGTPPAGAAAPAFAPPPRPVQPVVTPEMLADSRVGFRSRFLATLIDWLVLGAVMKLIDFAPPRFIWVLALLYFTAFWVWKQTTIGGIVLRLKVARLDGRPVDWATAAVRSVGALFGTLALGLGYFWSGWDSEKQGWHDKLAGTVVVKVARAEPLV